MAGEIEKFDPSKLVDQVRERIRNTFAELIPEDEWKKLVQREIAYFLQETRTRRNSYGNEIVERGALGELVDRELTAMLKELIKDEFASSKWNVWRDGNKQCIGTEVEKLILKNAPAILSALLGQSLQSLMSQWGMHIQR